jgi:O-succinylbenzoate synthase
VSRIAHYLEDGYQRVKIKIMPGWDVEPLIAVRKRFPRILLMVDANAAYRWPEHAEQLRALDQFDLMMIEQPIAGGAFEEMAEMRRTIKTPICVDESADSLASLEEIIRHGSASIVNIKVQRVGGLWNAKRMHDRAREAGLACWLGTMPELGIASAQALSIAALPGFVYPTDIEASGRWFVDDIISPAITISRNGFIVLPRRGAMHYEVDRAKLERYSIDTREFAR